MERRKRALPVLLAFGSEKKKSKEEVKRREEQKRENDKPISRNSNKKLLCKNNELRLTSDDFGLAFSLYRFYTIL